MTPVTSVGPELDAARAEVVARGLTGGAIAALTPVVSGFSIEALGPVKQQLKRYFSAAPWTEQDDDALAAAIDQGDAATADGGVELAAGVDLRWSWADGAFRLRVAVAVTGEGEGVGEDQVPSELDGAADDDFGATFGGVVVPEATPSPRTIRFATPPRAPGPSRSYDARPEVASAGTDPAVARLFREFPDVTNVLVGPDFVAVTASRPDQWPSMLVAILRAVTDDFVTDGVAVDALDDDRVEAPTGATAPSAMPTGVQVGREPGRLDQAWAELAELRVERPDDLARILAATADAEAARRQVAAVLLADAPPDDAAAAWARLLEDPSRSVRRAVVDTMADADRAELRPFLERALEDSDAWVRWKALRGVAAIGVGSSRARVEALGRDPDFRVRLDAARIAATRADAGSD